MSDSRRRILDALRAARRPFPDAAAPADYLPVVPRAAVDTPALVQQFALQAQQQAAQVHRAANNEQAFALLMALLPAHRPIVAWDPHTIPLPGLSHALREATIDIADPADPSPQIGLTGALAGLAATGSLVLRSGPGAYRNTSLLPPVHVAILLESQILPDLESWFAMQRADGFRAMRRASNIVVITGPSRTADIAMELVMGMHGPRELHILLLATDERQDGT